MGKQLVLAFFENEAAADNAVNQIKGWDKGSREIRLGAIGVLVKDDKGKIKTRKLGSRKAGTGALLFGLAAILTGGASLIAGAAVGGIVGAFFHKGLGMSKEDLAQIDGNLNDGKAAVGVLADPENAAAVASILEDLGGVLETYEVPEQVMAEVAAAAAEAPADASEEPAD